MKALEQMSDRELIRYAHRLGCEEFIVLDLEGGLADRKELIDVIVQCELSDYEWDQDEFDPAGGRGLYSHI